MLLYKVEEGGDFVIEWWAARVSKEVTALLCLMMFGLVMILMETTNRMNTRRIAYFIERKRRYFNTMDICTRIYDDSCMGKLSRDMKIVFTRCDGVTSNLYRLTSDYKNYNQNHEPAKLIEKTLYEYTSFWGMICYFIVAIPVGIIYMLSDVILIPMDTDPFNISNYGSVIDVAIILYIVATVCIMLCTFDNMLLKSRISYFIKTNRPSLHTKNGLVIDNPKNDPNTIVVPYSVMTHWDIFHELPFSIFELELQYNVMIYLSNDEQYYVKYLDQDSVVVEEGVNTEIQ